MPAYKKTEARYFGHHNGKHHMATITDREKTLFCLPDGMPYGGGWKTHTFHKAKGYNLIPVTINGTTRRVFFSGHGAPNYATAAAADPHRYIKADIDNGGYSVFYELHPDDEVYYVGRPFCDIDGKQWVVREKWVKWCGGAIPMCVDNGLVRNLDMLDRFVTRPKHNCGMLITEVKASAVYNPFDGPADPILAGVREKRIALNEAIAAEAMKPARVASRFERYGEDWDLYA